MELLILDKAAFPSGTVLSKQARTCAHTHTRTHALTRSLTTGDHAKLVF